MSTVQEHFDQIALDYDYWKQRNWYYYAQLKALLSELVPPGKKVLEIGCGTGDLLVHLRPSKGLGIDISPEMIQRAQSKYRSVHNVQFCASTIEKLQTEMEFDYIFMADVIEHLSDVPNTLRAINQVARSHTCFVMIMANPLWEPILLILEKLKMKMPEGPHHRLPLHRVRELLHNEGFVLKSEGKRVLVPAKIPWVSDTINAHFHRVPGLSSAGLVAWFLATKRR